MTADFTARITEILVAEDMMVMASVPEDAWDQFEHVAALIAQAAEEHYRPRIETPEQLAAAPQDSVIRDSGGEVLERSGVYGDWLEPGGSDLVPQLPAVLLWSPGAGE